MLRTLGSACLLLLALVALLTTACDSVNPACSRNETRCGADGHLETCEVVARDESPDNFVWSEAACSSYDGPASCAVGTDNVARCGLTNVAPSACAGRSGNVCEHDRMLLCEGGVPTKMTGCRSCMESADGTHCVGGYGDTCNDQNDCAPDYACIPGLDGCPAHKQCGTTCTSTCAAGQCVDGACRGAWGTDRQSYSPMKITSRLVTDADPTARLALFVGDSAALTAEPICGAHGVVDRDATLQWSSDDPHVARIAADGTVTAMGGGTTTLRAQDGAAGAKLAIDVWGACPSGTPAPSAFDDDPLSMTVGQVIPLHVMDDSRTCDLTDRASARTDNAAVVAVDHGTVLRAIAVGRANVTVEVDGIDMVPLAVTVE